MNLNYWIHVIFFGFLSIEFLLNINSSNRAANVVVSGFKDPLFNTVFMENMGSFWENLY